MTSNRKCRILDSIRVREFTDAHVLFDDSAGVCNPAEQIAQRPLRLGGKLYSSKRRLRHDMPPSAFNSSEMSTVST